MGVVRPPAGAVGVGEPARGEAEAGRGASGPMSCRRRGRRRHRRDAPQRRRMLRLLRHPPAPVTCHVSGRVRGRRRIVRVVGIAVVYVGAGGVGLLHLHRHMHLHLRLHLHLHLHLRLRLWLRLPATTSALVGHLALLRPLHGAARVSDRGVHNLIIVLLFTSVCFIFVVEVVDATLARATYYTPRVRARGLAVHGSSSSTTTRVV